MDEDEFSIFYGFGQCHDLRDAEYQPSRLAQFNFKSVKNTTSLNTPKEPKQRPVGFRFPWRR